MNLRWPRCPSPQRMLHLDATYVNMFAWRPRLVYHLVADTSGGISYVPDCHVWLEWVWRNEKYPDIYARGNSFVNGRC